MSAAPVRRLALVTGASRGIGAAAAEALSDKGCAVVLVCKNNLAMAEALAAALSGLIAAFDPKEILLESSRFPLDDTFMDILRDSIHRCTSPMPTITVSDNLLGYAMRGIAGMQREIWLRGLIT